MKWTVIYEDPSGDLVAVTGLSWDTAGRVAAEAQAKGLRVTSTSPQQTLSQFRATMATFS